MAAKVAMVAVPTVLSIASIRVYTVREAPTDGLVTREKLNIYTPLPPSAPAQFVPETPGAIQRGLTTARESVLPFVQAVKGACLSVKTGSVNLYHAGEDVYYYLKDPPPEFIPRFGTITMAGLLGMFLARKGSHFKRLAVPLGLMSAGASVCYPAQTVAVLKVTGKKVYAAGQWSSGAVSSLLASKPQEPIAKEAAASQPQAVPNPESVVAEEASSSRVESAESVAVVTEEASSVPEIPPDQTPTEISADLVAHSAPAETKTTTDSEEIPAPVESEEPADTKRAAAEDVSSGDASPAESTPSSEPETVEAAPVEVAPGEVAPVEVAPVETPAVETPAAEVAPVEVAPEEAPAAEVAPVETPAAEVTPVEAPAVETPAAEVPAAEVAPVEVAPEEAPAVETPAAEVAPVESSEVASADVESSEDPPVPKVSDEAAVVESAEPEPAPEPQSAAAEETPTPPPPPQEPAAENSKGGSGFKPDPALMDFGQSNPEDEDLYSTRS